MPSMKCYQCGKIKRCRMVMVRYEGNLHGHPEYLCSPCARELGYTSRSQDGK